MNQVKHRGVSGTSGNHKKPNGTKWDKIEPSESEGHRLNMLHDASRCFQMLPSAPRCCQIIPDARDDPRCCQSRWFFMEYYNNDVQELVPICLGWGAPPLVSVQMVVFSVLVQMGEFSSRGSWAKVPEPKLLSWSSESKVIKLKFLMYVCMYVTEFAKRHF